MHEPAPNDSARAAALAALATRGIPFDEQRALEYIRKGDARTVEVFLAAGLTLHLTDADGVPALVLAARGGHKDVCRLLLQHGAPPELMVDALTGPPKAPKDAWERLASISGVLTFVSTLVVAAVGWHFTNRYNERQQENAVRQAERDTDIRLQQARISEMDTVVKMIPHLTEGEQSKKAALLALSALATPELAVQMAGLFGGVGSVQALETIASQNPDGSKTSAVSALAGLATQHSAGEAAAASAANTALEGIFEGRERSLVSLQQGGSFSCNGFVADLTPAVILAPTYCISDAKTSGLTVRFWNGREAKVTGTSIHGPVARLTVADLGDAVRLSLAEAVPSPGARVLKIAYGMRMAGSPSDAVRLSVVSGVVEGTELTDAPESGSRGKVRVIRMRFTAASSGRGGEGGGPILDASGAVACMVYLSGPQSDLEYCLPGAVIRQSLSTVASQQ